ncbi:hypothetical protein M409DRAFT_59980 [Zasmidium cellare ATCC 36951]|uniref:Methyltransferase type 11 domain-containing protein n=1 Tax=Zasmidium cellare ATCC 36951 TaxID=1080233 RepID=A0A6A6C540_ZASCE|nr:uncharacterized protein M409DRAFT_59980 [Zasmidium cellare ATCC 36951]KAF2160506.1 hypothetical protein M409DRAFT_59980 [Zasmidium cellare ATCC 36951]
MSSLRAHFRNHAQQQDDPTTSQPPKPTSRIPTKSVAPDGGKQKKPVQHVSKLAKRSSRSIKSPEPSLKSSTTRTATPVTAVAQTPVGSSRGISVPPSGSTVPAAPPNMRTPSLVSGSSVSTFDSPRSALRRKPSGAIDKYAAQKRAESTGAIAMDRAAMHSRNDSSREEFDDTVLGISIPPTFPYDEQDQNAALDFYDQSITRDFTPPIYGAYAPSATPSTRYTDSPFSHVPTPSSASSYSPGLVVTTGNAPRPRQPSSPTHSRPPVSGRPPTKDEASRLGLPPVRESSTSSSNSTVRPEVKLAHARKEQARRAQNTLSPTTSNDERTTSPNSRHRKDVSTSSARPSIQVPPELAHLNVEPPPRTSLPRSPPPSRPSREGTANIADMNKPSPVVQSDLPRLYTTYHKRTPSQETPTSASSPSFKSRFGFSSRSSSRNESRIDSAISPPPGARQFHRSATPEVQSKDGAKLQRKDSPAVSAPSTAKPPRFGFFSRKPKAESIKTTEKPKRQPSKGPAAGTGHEGYGRFGVRGRSGSMSSSAGFRSPSTDSGRSNAARPPPPTARKSSIGSKNGSELDDFLRERLTPVILRGSGSTFSNTASSSDLPGTSLHPASSKSSSLDSLPAPQLLPSVMSESRDQSPMKRPPLARRMPSDSSEDDMSARYPSLATRRSLTRMSSADSRSPVRVPPPINTNLSHHNAPLDSYDAETSAWPQTDSSFPPTEDAFHGREGHWLASPISDSPVTPSRKWNFFQRVTASPRSKGKERAVERPIEPEVAARQPPPRNVVHYGMLGPVEPIALDEVERIAQENETSADDSMSESNGPHKMVPYERRHTSLLPSPPRADYSSDSAFRAKPLPPRITVDRQDSSESPELLRAQPAFAHQTANVVNISRSPQESFNPVFAAPPTFVTDRSEIVSTPEAQQRPFGSPEPQNGSPRQPRLSPVGRIPAVVSRRDRDRKLPDNSFSRPFARTQPRPSVKPPGSVYSQIREMASPIESNSQPVSSTSTRSDGNSLDPKSSTFTNPPSTSTNRTSMDIHAQSEFFTFPPRKNSEQSYSTSSGHPSWMTALYTQPPQQEDVWNEYNDFLDEVMPLKTPTTGSSLGAPFQYSSMLFDAASTPTVVGVPPSSQLPPLPEPHANQAVLSVPQQISQFLQPSSSPMTPDTIYGFIGGYGNRSTSTLYSQGRNSIVDQRASTYQPARITPPGSRNSVASSVHSKGSRHSRAASLPQGHAPSSQSGLAATRRPVRDAQLVNIAEIPGHEQGASPSLRIGALMTSKWLSFGRVLFSPAHNETHLAHEPKVLVVDGLSSDWSYYVALSYPAAEVYNLTPSMPGSPSFSWPDSNEKPPRNHRQIPLVSISTPFPFPKGFFTSVVFRFPKATTEQNYAACISECKRVLRPGGYLEVAILDLDLMNMGTKARRAVRGLKTRMQQRDPEVCLRNLSDILVCQIGRRGFEAVQRCIVGVPAAGRIPRSQDISSVSSGSSGKPVWHREARSSKSQEFSLADLLEDSRNNQFGSGKSNDETITKMVAKVGRWWYSTCYEKALLPTDQSIWADPTLLRECEKQGTSFRLLICHAQKPTQTRRRTVSV